MCKLDKSKVVIRLLQCEDVEVRSAEGEPTTITGYAVRWDKLSVPLWGFREKVARGAFSASIQKNNIKALWNHNSDMPLGNTAKGSLTLVEDDVGLRFILEPPDSSWGNDAVESIRRGDTDGVSFGFITTVDEWDYSDPQTTIRTIVEGELLEISPTPFPAYPDTSVAVRDSYKPQIPPQQAPEYRASVELLKRKIKLLED